MIIDVFHESENAVAALNNIKMTMFNLFLDGLTEDNNGNIVLTTTTTSELHTPSRKKT